MSGGPSSNPDGPAAVSGIGSAGVNGYREAVGGVSTVVWIPVNVTDN